MSSTICTSANPNMLSWSRESLNISMGDAAKRLRITEEQYTDIEAGDECPTLSQLRTLSAFYKRPVATFFMPNPPADTKKPKDYRSHDGNLTKKTLLSIRRARYIQKSYKELQEDTTSQALWKSVDSPISTAIAARQWLGLTEELQRETKDAKELFQLLVERLQEKNILVLLHSFPMDDARAYCFTDSPRVIVINTGDSSVEGRIFSLLHELTHLSQGDSGICLVHESYNQHAKERFCDKVATHALMPGNLVRSVVSEHGGENLLDDAVLGSVARKIKCSKLALLFRFVELSIITPDDCQAKRKEWAAIPPKKRGGGGTNRIATTLRENGTAYTGAVISAYKNNRINAVEAGRMLGINQAYVEQVGARIGQT